MPKTTDLARKILLSNKIKRYADLNTDLGQTRDQSFYERTEYELLNWVSSVNIPCCVHDGDPKWILAAIEKAKYFNCSVGAHIGYPDPAKYGYEPMELSEEDLTAWVYVQIGAFQALLRSKNLELVHIRPHGALYTAFVDKPEVAISVAKALYKMNQWFILTAPVGPVLQQVQDAVKIKVAPEVYLGKRYGNDGRLLTNRLHENLPPQGVLDQVRQLMSASTLTTADGGTVKVDFQTLHIAPTLENSVAQAEKISQLMVQPVALPLVEAGASGWL